MSSVVSYLKTLEALPDPLFSVQVNYWPSSLDDVQTSPNSKEAQSISAATITGQRVKQVG